MKHKILAFTASVALSGGLLLGVPLAAAPSEQITARTAAVVMGNFCAAAYKEWRRYGTTKYLDKITKDFTPEQRETIGISCYVYGRGYEDGVLSTRTA